MEPAKRGQPEEATFATEIANVPVPVRFLPEVYALLAELTSQTDAEPNTTAVRRPAEPTDSSHLEAVEFRSRVSGRWFAVPWVEGTRRSRSTGRMGGGQSPDGATRGRERGHARRSVLDAIAGASPMWVPFSVLAEEARVTQDVLRGQLAALTKLVRRLQDRKSWPFTVRYSGDEASYSMPVEVSLWWEAQRRAIGATKSLGSA